MVNINACPAAETRFSIEQKSFPWLKKLVFIPFPFISHFIISAEELEVMGGD